MPEISGLMLAQAIKAEPVLAPTPILLLTSLGRHTEPAGAGLFAGQLSKPLRREALREQLYAALGHGGDGRLAAPSVPGAPAAAVRPLRILVAEDNLVNQKVAGAMLKKLGLHADIVANGAEAVAALRVQGYDLVLMDCEMPVLDGFAATARIRAADSGVLNPAVPVIAMTAHALGGDRERCLAAGMNDYITKPVQALELAALLQRWG